MDGILAARGSDEQERMVTELDEFERGYPRLTLSMVIDVVGGIIAKGESGGKKEKTEEFTPYTSEFRREDGKAFKQRMGQVEKVDSLISRRTLRSKLWPLHRLRVFDNDSSGAQPLNYKRPLQPGQVSVLDLSDTGMSELSNIVIADLLRGVQEAQDAAYGEYEQAKAHDPDAEAPTRTLVIIEEAHEFLGAERIERMSSSSGRLRGSRSAGASAGSGWSSRRSSPSTSRARCWGWSTATSCTRSPTRRWSAASSAPLAAWRTASGERLPNLAPGLGDRRLPAPRPPATGVDRPDPGEAKADRLRRGRHTGTGTKPFP